MSELVSAHAKQNIRWDLLSGVSAAALLAICATDAAHASDTDRPTVWIELGAQVDRIDGGAQRFVPPFEPLITAAGFTSPQQTDRNPRYANGIEGKISFAPEGSDWVFSAALRYGRSNRTRSLHEQQSVEDAHFTRHATAIDFYQLVTIIEPYAHRFADTVSRRNESHTLVDFQAGKDVGLGLFGSSVLNAGVRFAQFESKSAVTVAADPDFAFHYKYFTQPNRNINGQIVTLFGKVPQQSWHIYNASAMTRNSFHGIGPMLSWNASLPVAGNADRMEVLFDWGVNGAVLFGRQKTQVHHQSSARYASIYNYGQPIVTAQSRPPDQTRTRSVVVPNLGGFAGMSLKFPNAKVSLGYRADFFFGAMDGGIDSRKNYDRNFHGPFATISIGLGG
jgi:hypothetical protein